MRTFQEFVLIAEASYDASVMSSSQIRRTGEGGRVGAERKKTPQEIRRTRAVGGGKTEPVAYKTRKDVGQQRGSSAPAPGRGAGATALKPGTAGTQGSAAMSAKERQRKAYLERKAREGGKEQPKTASQAISQAKPQQEKKEEEMNTVKEYLDKIQSKSSEYSIGISLRGAEILRRISQSRAYKAIADQRGDVPGWVLVVLMTTGLVTAIWTIAAPRLTAILRNSLDSMNGIR